MGKVVKTLAVIAVAAAVAYFAPQISAVLLQALGSGAVAGSLAATVATSFVAAGLAVAASYALQAFAYAPEDAPSGYRLATMQQDTTGLRMLTVEPPAPAPEVLRPIEPRSWRHAFFWPWQRFALIRIAGDCMEGAIPDGTAWGIVDREADIEPGCLFAFDVDDMWTAYARGLRFKWWWRLTSIGMAKRYLGTEREWGRLVFECVNPPSLCETGFNHVRYAYRITDVSRSWIGGAVLIWRLRRRIN